MPINTFNALRGKHLVEALTKRKMEACYVATKEEALEKAMSLLPEGASVAWGGSMSVKAIGLPEKVKAANYTVIDRDMAQSPEERVEIDHKTQSVDYYFMSTNALSLDGTLVNIDGFGNRVSALIFGPKNVVLIVGMNKVTSTPEEALSRVRNVAAPINCIRLGRNTPCAKTGFCHDCTADECICRQIVTTRLSSMPGRIKVILVGESLGF